MFQNIWICHFHGIFQNLWIFQIFECFKIFENFKRSWWLNRTELTKCNNIWSYIRHWIPPSVVALKFSYGSVINFFCNFETVVVVFIIVVFVLVIFVICALPQYAWYCSTCGYTCAWNSCICSYFIIMSIKVVQKTSDS